MKNLLQGSWLGHPLHPAIVHIPSALWPAAVVFDLLTLFDVGGNPLVRASFLSIIAGLIAAAIAIPTGLADWLGIKRGRPAWQLGLFHLILNASATVLFAASLVFRLDGWRTDAQAGIIPFVLAILGAGALGQGGYFGGKMAYDYGISVARVSKDEWRETAEAGGARLPEKG
ncbi:MAG: DUF2231 domain-containing protein [Thermomicrobiales bacterium]